MAIRQIKYEKGEEMGIRDCKKLEREDTVVNNLRELDVKEDTFIVKCGKSYYDVASKLDIFEAAEPFDIDTLTSIDARDAKESTTVKKAFATSTTENVDPMSMLYKKTDSEEEEEEPEIFDRKTYYLRQNQVVALNLLCTHEHSDISEMVRELLDIAFEIKSEEYGGRDFLGEADTILLNTINKPKKRKTRKTSK